MTITYVTLGSPAFLFSLVFGEGFLVQEGARIPATWAGTKKRKRESVYSVFRLCKLSSAYLGLQSILEVFDEVVLISARDICDSTDAILLLTLKKSKQ